MLDLFTQLARQVHQAQGKPLPLDEELTRHYNERLQAAVTLGYEAHDVSQAEFLRANVQLFSAAKTAHATQALTDLLLDENGKLKPWPVFKEEALGLHQQYNVNWLRAEYEHAVASAQMAARWQEFEPADLLEYQTVGDDRVRAEHAAWNGITRPADDAWWQTHYPPCSWGCRCTAVIAAPAARMTPRSVLPALPDPDPLFRNNVGVTGIIFPEGHPYFSALKQGPAIVAPPAAPPHLVSEGFQRVYTSPGGGVVDVHPAHGADELKENLVIGQHLADAGEKVALLPIVQGGKNLDATRNGVLWEFKAPTTDNAKTAMQNAVKSASAQEATRVLIHLNARMSLEGTINGLKLAFSPGRAKKITDVGLLLPDGQLLEFTADQMRAHVFIDPLKNRGGGQLH